MAFGEMLLLPDDFYRMSWREFLLMVRGFRKREQNDFLQRSLLSREVAYQIYCAMPLKKGKRHVDKKKYWPHPWDTEKESKDVEMLKNAMEILKARAQGDRSNNNNDGPRD